MSRLLCHSSSRANAYFGHYNLTAGQCYLFRAVIFTRTSLVPNHYSGNATKGRVSSLTSCFISWHDRSHATMSDTTFLPLLQVSLRQRAYGHAGFLQHLKLCALATRARLSCCPQTQLPFQKSYSEFGKFALLSRQITESAVAHLVNSSSRQA